MSGGGYTWAKHGFAAINKPEVKIILEKAENILPKDEYLVVRSIYENYYKRNPNGKDFPIDLWAAIDFMKKILMGSDWHGEIDLTNSHPLSNFKYYVFRE